MNLLIAFLTGVVIGILAHWFYMVLANSAGDCDEDDWLKYDMEE